MIISIGKIDGLRIYLVKLNYADQYHIIPIFKLNAYLRQRMNKNDVIDIKISTQNEYDAAIKVFEYFFDLDILKLKNSPDIFDQCRFWFKLVGTTWNIDLEIEDGVSWSINRLHAVDGVQTMSFETLEKKWPGYAKMLRPMKKYFWYHDME